MERVAASLPQRTAILVLGMHRSGTSALTRVLNLLGAALPRHVLEPGPGNEAGFWEPKRIVDLHEQMLAEAGSTWDDRRKLDLATQLPVGRLDHYKTKIRRLIGEEYGEAPLFVLKDPRICRFVPLYRDLLENMGMAVRPILMFRSPLEVAASLAARDGLPAEVSHLYWLRHVLDAEADTRTLSRAVMSYDELLTNWRSVIEASAATLGIRWPRQIEDSAAEVDAFLSVDYHHQSVTHPISVRDDDLVARALTAYDAMLQLRDTPTEAIRALDEVGLEFNSVEGTALALSPMLLRHERVLANLRNHYAQMLQSRHDEYRRTLEQQKIQATADLAQVQAITRELQASLAKREATERELVERLRLAELAQSNSEQRAHGLRAQLDNVSLELRNLHASYCGFSRELDLATAELQAFRNLRILRLTAPLRRIYGHLRKRTNGQGTAASTASEYSAARGNDSLITQPDASTSKSAPALDVSADFRKDIEFVRESGYFDVPFYRQQLDFSLENEFEDIAHYLTLGWKLGLDPTRTFSTSGYLLRYPDIARAGLQPLLHYLRLGHSEGRNPNPFASRRETPAGLKRFGVGYEYGPIDDILRLNERTQLLATGNSLCVHVHLFYEEMASEVSLLLNRIARPFTLLVSIREGSDPIAWLKYWQVAVKKASRVIIRNTENRGRDALPWVVTFRNEIMQHDLFCHFHTKRSPHDGGLRYWRRFLAHTMLGSTSIANQILNKFESDPNLGLVYPPYFPSLRNQPNFGGTREVCSRLLSRIGFHPRPERCADYPAGSFFWCRTRILKPLFDINLQVSDFEPEHGQLCGTLAHGIERIIGFLPRIVDMKSSCVAVDWGHEIAQDIPATSVGGSDSDDIFLKVDSEGNPTEETLAEAAASLRNLPLSVSVVMPTWNREATVVAALRSALEQTYPPREVILIDDGSTDNTVQIVKTAFSTEIERGQVLLIQSDHGGVSSARNKGLDMATGDLVAYLDSDNTWRKDYLKVMTHAFASAPWLDTAYCDLLKHESEKSNRERHGHPYFRPALLRSNFIDLNTFVHRRHAGAQASAFDGTLTRLVDWEFIIRMTDGSPPAYIPFVGVDYFLDQRRLGNVTYTVPLLENLEKVNRKHYSSRLLFDGADLRIAIKCPVPNMREAHAWGDYHFARSLKLALERHGCQARIDLLPEWGNRSPDDDVAIVLRGLSSYEPSHQQINLLWNISHPDKLTLAELDRFDHVFFATNTPPQALARALGSRASVLLQCSDPLVFQPLRDNSAPLHDMLFVGNSRGVDRWMPSMAVELGLPIAVYGAGWEGRLPEFMIMGRHIPNEQLSRYYSHAKIVLNDHWPDMASQGYISNRIFDVALCETFIISDNFANWEGFGGALSTVKTKQQLREAVAYWLEHDQARQEQARRLRSIVLKGHTFDHRAEAILDVIRPLLSTRFSLPPEAPVLAMDVRGISTG